MASTDPWEKVVREMKKVGHGEIRNLKIVGGVPEPDSIIEFTKSRLLAPRAAPSAHGSSAETQRSMSIVELKRLCRKEGNTIIQRIHVQDGMPSRVEMDGSIPL